MALREQSLTKTFLVFMVFFLSCKRTPTNLAKYDIDKITLVSKSGESFFNQLKFSGIVYKVYSNNDTLILGKYLLGKKDGVWKNFYKNGKLKEFRNYENGIKNGKHFGFYQNGNKQFEYDLKDNEYNGQKKVWNKSGLLIQEATFLMGYENGSQKIWYDNGSIKSNYFVKNGRRFGLLGTKNCVNVKDSIM